MKIVRTAVVLLLACCMLFGSASLAATATPAPTPALKVDGTVSGTVVNVTEKDIVINLANGNTVMFMLDHIEKTDAIVGDTVTIEYNGNVIDSPQAVTITVTKKVLGGLTISGTVMTFDENRIFIVISSKNAYGFVKDTTTTISGLATTLADDDEVTITYTGDLNSIPFAKDINITKVASGKSRTSGNTGRTTNKTLDGYVSALTTKLVTIYTNSGRSYSFKLSKDVTKITGNYDFETGCRVRVTYDGYASVSPLAKAIRVLSKSSPVTPKPVKPTATPKPGHKTYTVSGTVTYFNGIDLELSNGGEYDTTDAVFSGTGYGESGESAKVTYYISENGVSYATKVVFTAPKPTNTPKPTTHTTTGTVSSFGGMYLELTNGTGFDVTYASYSGSGDGTYGDTAKVTYYVGDDGMNYATKIVFTAPEPDPEPYYEPDPEPDPSEFEEE